MFGGENIGKLRIYKEEIQGKGLADKTVAN